MLPPGTATAAALAAIAWLALPAAHLGFDSTYMVLRADALIDGHGVDLHVSGAPTPHPLQTVLAAPLTLVSVNAAATFLLLLSFAAYGISVVAAAAIADRLAGPWAALLGGAIVALSVPFVIRVAEGYQDVLAVALTLVALAMTMREPKRLYAPLTLLLLAGLTRPELWLLGPGLVALRWHACTGRGRPAALALALAPPLLWALSDLITTGDPMASFNRTHTAGAVRLSGIENVPEAFGRNLVDIIGLGPAIGGLLLAPAFLIRGRRWLPLFGFIGLSTAGYAALGAANMPLHDRYMLIPALLIGVAFASAIVVSLRSATGRRRRAVAVAAVLLVAVGTPGQMNQARAKRADLVARAATVDQLAAALATPASDAALASCHSVGTNFGWFVPRVALETERRVVAVTTATAAYHSGRAGPPQVLVIADPALRARVDLGSSARIMGRSPYAAPLAMTLAPGHRVVAQAGGWTITAAACAGVS